MAGNANIALHIDGFEGFDRKIDFKKGRVRAAMRKAGRLVAGQAQMNLALAHGAVGYPRVRSGALRDSIAFKVSRSGFMVRVEPKKTEEMKAPYFVYLHYGVRRGARRGKGRRAQSESGYRIKPRANYMVDALADKSTEVKAILAAALASALEIR
ncbi:hypothetical protein LGN06_04305 [Burkholderia vietnamiensis]|uniref:hypothetical protein n=1 Tax=Burkholderia vietnamiensis TaxID=60552 RepID=UPI0009BDE72E|nr:hypothetical protein [Burkholderia vietnamiensis]MCA8390787.1 hypothetical protein [Burkholderia vietnamiensis]HDR8956671.1 hypothetical protein [Burkholderia vietnamiensis]HDR9049466.1 hypothetical protein [Burkholderia vietnamiensis]HDR9231673.1 hypothetical protein [Burkholderia vietnamiensis]HDR9243244.1 hypothetical protein [Burkholderia vietnamiensis]